MKRAFFLLLAVVLILSLAACTGKQIVGAAPAGNESITEESASASQTTEVDVSRTDTEALETEETEPPEETPAPEDAAETPPDGESSIELGVITDSTYENRALGIGLALDENWTYASEETLGAMNGDVNLLKALLNGEDIRDLIQGSPSSLIYVMFAEEEDTLSNLSLNFEYLGELNGSVIDEEAYQTLSIDSVLNATDVMDAFSDVAVEKDTVVLAGAERPALRVHGVVFGEQDYYQTLVFMKSGHYMAVFTLTSFRTDTTDEMAGYFYALD